MFGYNLNNPLAITLRHRMTITSNNCYRDHGFAFYLLRSNSKITHTIKISRDRHVGTEELKFDILGKQMIKMLSRLHVLDNTNDIAKVYNYCKNKFAHQEIGA